MTATLRIKIEYAGNSKEDNSSLKFVYVIDSPRATTIDKLITDIQEFIVTQFGLHNMRLVDLVTDDGYILMKQNICVDVLNNNEKLVCVDMDRFVAKNKSTLNFEDTWLKLEQHDASDNIQKSLTVGVNNAGKLYVYLFGGRNMQGLYLFNVFELLAMVCDESEEIDHFQMKIPIMSSSEWFISAQWTHDPTSNNTLFLVGNLKTGDTSNILSNKLRIHLNESTKTIEKGEVIPLSNQSNEDATQMAAQTQVRLDELKKTIPSPSRTGPVLDTKVPIAKIYKHECAGDSPILIIQGKESSVDVEQEIFARDDSFRNLITITDIIISKKPVVLPEILTHKRSAPAEKPIAIAQVQVHYQWHDGKWLDCEDAKIAIASGQQDDRRKIVTSILNIEPDKLISVSIYAAIRVKGNPNRNNMTRSRAHRSLPQPLKLKIIFTDNLSKTCSLIVEQMNRPLQIITKESFLKSKENDVNKLIAFIYVDDCEYDERSYIAVYIDKEHHVVIGDEGSYTFMNKAQMRTRQFNAKKSGKTEELIEFISRSDRMVTSLFDPETFLLYAIRIELTSTTSKTVETVLLPLDEIK
ncbi:unnamed protein product [Rotaria sp. Silwood1]|nr:unnamed protein product [Rotaria sp. Silwood1]